MNYTGKTLTSAPAVEPVSTAQPLLRDQLRVDFTEDNSLLDIQAKAARQRVEDLTGRALVTQTWTVYWDCFPDGDTIELPFPPLQSVTHVKYYDTDGTEATFSAASYDVDVTGTIGLIRLKYNQSWPTTTLQPTRGVEVQQVVGYGAAGTDVPEYLRQAIVLEVATAYYGPDKVRNERIHQLITPAVVMY